MVGTPEAQGVYQLSLQGKVVYIGKTDADAGLRRRLERHSYSIQDRSNLNAEGVTFKAVRVFVFTAMDLETQLIDHYGKPAWNFSGFGSNDPGRKRDHTKVLPTGFDATYPIDIDRALSLKWNKKPTASEILVSLKQALPYTFRFELQPGGRKLHKDFAQCKVSLPVGPLTVRTILTAVISALPNGWQATVLPSRLIMYRERVDYEFGKVIARKPA
jgi:hypothetical protein